MLRALVAFAVFGPTLAFADPAHPMPQLPEWYRNLHAGETQRLTYNICAGDDGKVTNVLVMAGRRPIDDEIVAHIKSMWTYAQPGCKDVTIGFRFTGPQNLQSGDALKLYDPSAHGPSGSYAFCVGTDGNVLDVRVLSSLGSRDVEVVQKIRAGHYDP